MPKIEEVVRNVVEESEKANYEPTKESNWCHLPMEMRMSCIGKMDFKTRTRLSVTSMIETSLVGSKKYKFDKILIHSSWNMINSPLEVGVVKRGKSEEIVEVDMKKSHEEKLQFIRFVLKNCEIDEFCFYDNDRSKDMINPVIDFADCVPFTAKELDIDCSWEKTKFFLENCPSLEVITSDSIFRFVNILDISTVTSVKEIRLTNCHLNNVWNLIWKWIETDAELWKSIQFKSFNSERLDMFAEEFKDRLIQRKLVYIRVRMDDPSKQILVRHVGADTFGTEYYSCKIIPMDLPEKEFRKGDTWIEDVLREDDEDDNRIINYGYTDQFLRGPMENIKKAVQNVMEESEKINYDPAKDTNWCHLPMEMRMECIQRMYFKTRTRLSASSMTEKSLVGSQKYHFDKVIISYMAYYTSATARNGHPPFYDEDIRVEYVKSHENTQKSANFLLKSCEIEELRFDEWGALRTWKQLISDFDDCVPFRFKRFTSDCSRWELIRFFLNNCENLEVITSGSLFTFDGFVDIPAVLNAKQIRVPFCKRLEDAWNIVSKWIEIDADVGKSVQFCTDEDDVNDLFEIKFEDRIINQTDSAILIRTDNETKAILLRKIGSLSESYREFMSCKVIPIDLPESEYAHGDEWITELFEEQKRSEDTSSEESDGSIDRFEDDPALWTD